MNVLKLLEEDCGDCLEITNIHNNGDSTINVTVRIKHPKPTEPMYTGFDVKGILMFNGSHEMQSGTGWPPWGDPVFISWREMGDPQVLNADGYTFRWSPSYDSGSDLPLLNYWPGKYAMGPDPTANLNAYLNFYTHEERHMFSVSGQVTREYHIYLPPGPVTAGYAVEACWVPPDVTPVTDPINDFPISANQEEPYHVKLVINNGEPVEAWLCCGWEFDCTDLYLEVEQWGGVTVNDSIRVHYYNSAIGSEISLCDDDSGHYLLTAWGYGAVDEGHWQSYAVIKFYDKYIDKSSQFAFTVFEWIKP